MKIKYLCALLWVALIDIGDDSTTGSGSYLIYVGDKISANIFFFKQKTAYEIGQ